MATRYLPDNKNISAITKGRTTLVQTDSNHDFNVGNTVYFEIPTDFIMRELDGMIGDITAVTSNTFTVDIDSQGFSTFSVPGSFFQPAQAIPVGSTNYGLENQGIPALPVGVSGSFRVELT